MNRPNIMHACLQGAGELFQGISGQYHFHLSYLTIIKHLSHRTPYILTHLSYHPSHVSSHVPLTAADSLERAIGWRRGVWSLPLRVIAASDPPAQSYPRPASLLRDHEQWQHDHLHPLLTAVGSVLATGT